jgi:hypothetical protein
MKNLLFFVLFSSSAFADYVCEIKLAHSEDFKTTIATKSISEKANKISTVRGGVIVVEDENGNRRTVVEISGIFDTFKDSESVSLSLRRKYIKKKKEEIESMPGLVEVIGNSKATGFIDSYKLDAECKITEESPAAAVNDSSRTEIKEVPQTASPRAKSKGSSDQ